MKDALTPRTLRIFAFLALLGFCVVIGYDAASAHSKKTGTEPIDGAVLASSPQVISMQFDRPIRITFIQLLDASGAHHTLERTDKMEPVMKFVAKPSALAPGRYKIEWRGLATDGHPMKGTFSFDVAQ